MVYEGKDCETEQRLDALNNSNYDADISNCSIDLHGSSSSSSSHACLHDENDGGIGHEDESNLDQSLYGDEEQVVRARDSGNLEDIDKEQLDDGRKFLNLPELRAPSPHSMDSWINYSNSSDEYSTQELIVRKGTKLNLHDDDATQDNDDVDVYDKINFVNAKSMTSSFKKSKIDGSSPSPKANTAKTKLSKSATSTIRDKNINKSSNNNNVAMSASSLNPFQQFPKEVKHLQSSTTNKSTSMCECDGNLSKAHETDDGIGADKEEEVIDDDDDDDDDQLSSLSSNIDTIIVSESGETKFFNASGENTGHPSVKKKKSCDSDNKGGVKNMKEQANVFHANGNKIISPLVDVRIIDFAHTTFSTKEPSPYLDESEIKKIHHGPDGGFLTGIASLKRILSEIIVEAI